MQTLDIPQKSEVVRHTTVTLPYYATTVNGMYYYAITGAKNNLMLATACGHWSISTYADIESMSRTGGSVQISEEQFMQAYEKALAHFADKVRESLAFASLQPA